jgi:prepilin-type N-terminal cleavage/methylation domain-containing protein
MARTPRDGSWFAHARSAEHQVPTSCRRGFSILELLASLVVCAIVLAVLARAALNEQQLVGLLSDRVSGRSEMQVATSAVAVDLRMLRDASDVRAGEARDSALEFRETIATAIICAGGSGLATLAPEASTRLLASYLRQPEVGDTAWVLDSAAAWHPAPITAVAKPTTGQCGAGGPQLSSVDQREPRVVLRFASGAPIAVGAPMRITRPFRYSFYKSSDRAWYLGAKDWNASTGKFNTIQPVGGPFLLPSSTGTAFAFFDSAGTRIATPVTAPQRIAAVRIAVLAQARRKLATRLAGASVDTALVTVHLHRSRVP